MLDKVAQLIYNAIYLECYEGGNPDWGKVFQVWGVYSGPDSVEKTNSLECNLVGLDCPDMRSFDVSQAGCNLILSGEVFSNEEGNPCESFKVGIR